MPRTKQRSIRRPKQKAPRRDTKQLSNQADTPTRSATTATESDAAPVASGPTTASERKLSHSPHTTSEYPCSSLSSSESESESEGGKTGSRILEVRGIQSALGAVCCKECGGLVSFKDELHKREGLCTHPYLFCNGCQSATSISFAKSDARSLTVNRRTVLANKCVGGSYTSPETLLALLDIPPPVSHACLPTTHEDCRDGGTGRGGREHEESV